MRASRVYVADCSLGKGLFAAEFIPAQSLILELRGPWLGRAQVAKLGAAANYAIQVGPTTYFDPEPPGRYVNHSCNPNAGLQHDHLLIARVDIPAGQQICFDYSTTMSECWWTMQCRCGQPNCRTTVKDFHDLPYEVKSLYLREGVVQKFIVAEHQSKKLAS